ncbi:DNA methyltransferase [Methylorubrum extorquens]|uniref:DNA adenine methylase n=1 Tax=Methylorubrum extorquens TaxID=408 RepID=UPI00097278B0|nr:DNA adenine methylase [Methylorubrum extorquens]APX83789.1 DNA methyltransferase [Methylorubrum extorquens]
MARTNSPLRYPGGKSCLFWLTADVLKLNKLERGHYAEPYAGGCGLALSLLYGGHVADIHINDLDPAIWAFWHSVLHDTAAFVERIKSTPVNIDEWLRQRDIYRDADNSSTLDLAFSAFFLNRTNRSGIIKGGGVIGGVDQSGPYKIDCRYNFDDLVRRIGRIRKYADRIHLSNMDALDFMDDLDRKLPAQSLWFIDPPYFNKGADLYTSFYKNEDHLDVADVVSRLTRPYVVTYDDTPQIRNYYRDRRQYSFDISYSLAEKKRGSELFIVSKRLKVPSLIKEKQVHRPQCRAA